MVFTNLEIIALIVFALLIIKLIFLSFSRNSWLKIAEAVWAKPRLIAFVYFVIAIVIFYFLILELTMVQIFVALTFGALLMAIGFTAYSKDVMKIARKALKQGLPPALWAEIIIWLIISVWAVYTIFA